VRLRKLIGMRLDPRIPRVEMPCYRWREPPHLRDYTPSFFRIINRPISRVEYIAFLLAGRQGSGKTTFIEWTAEKIVGHYGEDNVNAVGNKYGDLDLLMSAIDSRPVQVLACDDAYGSLPKDLNRKFTRIRHVFTERLREAGRPLKGVIYAFYAVQDYFQIDTRIRRTVNGTIMKSSVLNPYDKSLFKRILEEEGYQKLEEIDHRILYNYEHEARGVSVVVLQGLGRPGYIRSGVPERQVLQWLERETPPADLEVEETSPRGVELIRVEKDEAFLGEILAALKTRISGRDLGIFRDYLDGDSSREISRRLNLTDRRVRQIIAAIREEHLGYAAEEAYHRRHPRLERGGENTPLPDFIDHQAHRIISFKAYLNPEIGPGSGVYLSRRVGRKELEYASGHGYDLHLIVYELTARRWLHWTLPNPTPTAAADAEKPEASGEPGEPAGRGGGREGGVG